MAPDAFLAVQLAQAMVQENIGRARRVGARIIADDTVEDESGFNRHAFKPAVEEIASGGREEIEQIPLQVEPEGSNSVGYPTGLDQFGDRGKWVALNDVWRRLEHAGDVCRKHGISEATFYKWKSKYGGMDVSEAKRLKALEEENTKMKKLLADAMLDNAALKDLLAKKW